MGNCTSAPSEPQQLPPGRWDDNAGVIPPGPRPVPHPAFSQPNTGTSEYQPIARRNTPIQGASLQKKPTYNVSPLKHAPTAERAEFIDPRTPDAPKEMQATPFRSWQAVPLGKRETIDGIPLLDANEYIAVARIEMSKSTQQAGPRREAKSLWGDKARDIAYRGPTSFPTQRSNVILDPAVPLFNEERRHR